ncbi:alpha-(1,6)-fucosyltransferase-like [Haemaphysalis longicornis]
MNVLDLPSSIMGTLVVNHGDPYAWWYGVLMAYFFRLWGTSRWAIEDFKKDIGYKHPIVALHIRRSNESGEAPYHDLDEYMLHAEDFYARLALTHPSVEKRIFVATDTPSVIPEIISRFPSYAVISTRNAAKKAFRTAKISPPEVPIMDIHLLAESDYLICTFSSGFCRVAYKLMQGRHAEAGEDATRLAVSLDVEYYFAYRLFPPRKTLYRNEGVFKDEIEWSAVGGLIERANKFASLTEALLKKYGDGFNTGRIAGTRTNGSDMVFPRFKTVQTYSSAHYTSFNPKCNKL